MSASPAPALPPLPPPPRHTRLCPPPPLVQPPELRGHRQRPQVLQEPRSLQARVSGGGGWREVAALSAESKGKNPSPPAGLPRYKINLMDRDANGFVKKVSYIDLLDIKVSCPSSFLALLPSLPVFLPCPPPPPPHAPPRNTQTMQDPNGVATIGTIDGVFTFPFFTIENVDVFNANQSIVVVSRGRDARGSAPRGTCASRPHSTCLSLPTPAPPPLRPTTTTSPAAPPASWARTTTTSERQGSLLPASRAAPPHTPHTPPTHPTPCRFVILSVASFLNGTCA